MKALSFAALFFSFIVFAQAQDSDKTLVKTLDPEEASSVTIDFDAAQINPQPWDGGSFRIELVIKANMPIQVLEQLVKVGRYSLEGVKEGDKYYVTAPNLGKNVSVRGKDLVEEITVNIKTPGAFALANQTLERDLGVAARGVDDAQIKEKMKITNSLEIPEVTIESTLKSSNVDLKLKTGDIVIGDEIIEIDKP